MLTIALKAIKAILILGIVLIAGGYFFACIYFSFSTKVFLLSAEEQMEIILMLIPMGAICFFICSIMGLVVARLWKK